MQVSHSRVETFVQCPYKFRLRYIDKLQTIPDLLPDDPLIIGTALHTGIEKDVKSAIAEYYSKYPIITDAHIEEAMKLEAVIPMCKELLPEGGICELKIECPEFIGFMDYLVPVGKDEEGEEWFDLYDFKYSNNRDRYRESGQLHEYKWYFEKCNPQKHIRKTYFLFAPKVAIRRKRKPREETLEEFRLRLKQELQKVKAELLEIPYETDKVKLFLKNAKDCRMADTFPKNQSKLCDWCEYQNYCEKGDTTMILPKNERRVETNKGFKRIWIYGLPFSGKTYLANQFNNVLMLNTDGNVNNVDAPVVPIKDVVTTEGRITKRKFAWDVFKDVIEELEKGSDFETVVVDLLEDTYEYCRLWCYNHLGIEHESDDSFRAWDFVRTEFLSTLKRLMNLQYNIILISHEDTSKDITKRSGDKITAIKPNINEKVALKVAGMTDVVIRAINDEGKRTLSFKTNEVVFGGGRITLKVAEIPASYDALIDVLGGVGSRDEQPELPVNEPEATSEPETEIKHDEPQVTMCDEALAETTEQKPVAETPEQPKRRTRRTRS